MIMSMSFTHFFFLPLFVSGVDGLGGSHMNVMLGVRDITNTSATLDWMVPDDKPIVGFKVGSESIKIAVSFTWMIFFT